MSCPKCVVVPLVKPAESACTLCGDVLCVRHLAEHARQHWDQLALHKMAFSVLNKKPQEVPNG